MRRVQINVEFIKIFFSVVNGFFFDQYRKIRCIMFVHRSMYIHILVWCFILVSAVLLSYRFCKFSIISYFILVFMQRNVHFYVQSLMEMYTLKNKNKRNAHTILSTATDPYSFIYNLAKASMDRFLVVLVYIYIDWVA